MRTEREDVPSYRPENPGIDFGFGQKIAPRVGFAWDVKGDSSLKAYGSWGMFYDQMKLTLGRVMFGADRWMNWHFTLDTFDWPSITCTDPPNFGSAACPGTFIESFDFRPVANDANDPNFQLVDPDLNPIRTQEFTLGLDRELTKTMSVGVRYVHKWIDYAIEAVCAAGAVGRGVRRQQPRLRHRDVPVRHEPAGAAEGRARLRRLRDPGPQAARRTAGRSTPATCSASCAATGRASPARTKRSARCSRTPAARSTCCTTRTTRNGNASYGPLGTDRPHQFKVQATYSTPWGTVLGTNILAETGVPLSTVANEKGMTFFPNGRGDLGRTPTFSQVDVFAQQDFRLKGSSRVSFGVNVINLFDQDTPTAYVVTPYRDNFNIPDQQFFAGWDPEAVVAATPNFRRDARYRMASGYQERRSIRLQAKFSF